MTNRIPFFVERSLLEEGRYGIRAARAFIDDVKEIDNVVAFCRRDETQLLIVRCPAVSLEVAQALEAQGARLMDTLLFFQRRMERSELPARSSAFMVREAVAADAGTIGTVARNAFTNFLGHYHADPRLNRASSDEAYVEWAERSVTTSGVAGSVFVAEDEHGIVGFSTVRLNSSDEGEGVLFGVLPRAQGKGICRELMIAAMHWGADAGASRMVVPTQITNIASQKVWLRLGFEPNRAVYTFHWWFREFAPSPSASTGRH